MEKVYNRGDRTVQAIAEDLNINSWTLKNWMKLPKAVAKSQADLITKRPQDWSLSERFQLILESQGKEEEALYCQSAFKNFHLSASKSFHRV